jgi:hypothetical protein
MQSDRKPVQWMRQYYAFSRRTLNKILVVKFDGKGQDV